MTLEYLEEIGDLTELDRVWQLFCNEMASYGFDRLIYGYNRFGTQKYVGPWQDALILSNLDRAFLKVFVEEEYYLHAPLAEWALNNTGARSWSYLARDFEKLTDKQREVVRHNMANGLTAGYSVSFATPSPRSRAALAMAARSGLSQDDVNAVWERHGRKINVIANMTHLKIISLPHVNERSKLSRRQQEVLDWVADGKTYQDIATILGVSVATVEKHLRLVREKLDVETTPQAVLKASFWNQMFVVRG
ncbi:MAG TPA: LuxR family transcriptional regulator [Aliiroseovarius sp.]|nr:LuxR family transcriptional regulator [Aliiroseovarius sp.]